MQTDKQTNHKGKEIVAFHNDNGYGVKIDDKPLTQFENPLEYYWFSNVESAIQSAKQQIDRS